MQDEKYVNYYIETLTGTMTDCVVRNVSMQANLKVKDDIIKQQADKIGEFAQANEELFNELEALKQKSAATESEKVNSLNVELVKKGNAMSEMSVKHQAEIKKLNDEIQMLNRNKAEYDKVKSQAQHVDTFRAQLVKEREAHEVTKFNYEKHIEALQSQIETLTTPTKKKKAAPKKAAVLDLTELVEPTEDVIKDGGSF
jgi:chromosome segregation ATPase